MTSTGDEASSLVITRSKYTYAFKRAANVPGMDGRMGVQCSTQVSADQAYAAARTACLLLLRKAAMRSYSTALAGLMGCCWLES